MISPRWIFVDDQNDAATAFAQRLSSTGKLTVDVLGPGEAKLELLTGKSSPDGVLMDVDFSSAVGETGTGPGIAQDIRVKQKAKEITEFPVVRFAAIGPVEKNIKGDPASDDLFDLKIQKESLFHNTENVLHQLYGLSEIYTGLKNVNAEQPNLIEKIIGLDSESWSTLGHAGFESRLLAALQSAPHVAAGTMLRDFLLPIGLLLDETVLAIRLGIDISKSGESWSRLKEIFPFRYEGLANSNFLRWWARGLELWWQELSVDSAPLSSLNAVERVAHLSQYLSIQNLVPLTMPSGSAGTKPWRLCSLMAEREPKEDMALDPLESVRMMPRTDIPPWVDPLYAALGPVLQQGKDFRLNQSDLIRLRRKYK